MGLLDILTGKKAKQQHALAQQVFDVLEQELGHDRKFLNELAVHAATLNVSDKPEYERTTLNGRQCFRMIGMSCGNESLFDDIAAGTRYFPPIGQVMISVMILRLFQEHGTAGTLQQLISKIDSGCTRP